MKLKSYLLCNKPADHPSPDITVIEAPAQKPRPVSSLEFRVRRNADSRQSQTVMSYLQRFQNSAAILPLQIEKPAET